MAERGGLSAIWLLKPSLLDIRPFHLDEIPYNSHTLRMARRNRNDKLTRNPQKSPYWLINFRISEDLYDHPLFIGRNLRAPFQKSTGETDYGAAARVRDQFFKEHDIFQPKKTPDEHYADVLSGQTILTKTDRAVIHEELAEKALDGLTQANTPFHAMMEGDIH